MRIGVPKETKVREYRVGMTPTSVREAVNHGHDVIVEAEAGAGIGATNAHYERAGATIAASAANVFAQADMIIKVKEPQADERAMLREGQVLFTYLHLAPDPGTDRRSCEKRRRLYRLRNGDVTHRRAAAAGGPCPKWLAGCRSRPAHTSWKKRTAGLGFFSAACRALILRKSLFLAVASLVRTPSTSHLEWVRTSGC